MKRKRKQDIPVITPSAALYSIYNCLIAELTFKVVVLLSDFSLPSFSLLLFFLEVERSLSLPSLYVSRSLFFSFLFLFKNIFIQIK